MSKKEIDSNSNNSDANAAYFNHFFELFGFIDIVSDDDGAHKPSDSS